MGEHIITRRLEFDAGHRVYKHEGKCSNVHGHRYVVEVSVQAENLDSVGRVIDFSVIKTVCGTWLDENWDHGMILWKDDPIAPVWTSNEQLSGHKHWFMTENPTAENMAAFLFDHFKELLEQYSIEIYQIKVYETPNCWAVYPG